MYNGVCTTKDIRESNFAPPPRERGGNREILRLSLFAQDEHPSSDAQFTVQEFSFRRVKGAAGE